jgi:Holliday junction DNA helicase RuvB
MQDDQPEISDPSPPTLNHVIGQKQAVQQLRTALDAYYNDRPSSPDGETALCHVLLCGPPGTGKSLLSQIIARELASGLHEELAQNIFSPGHLQGLLMLAEPGDVVFVDEIHELPAVAQTTLYRCLEERRLFLGGDRKNVTLPPFTFIGATTDQWALSKPLRDRFKVILHLTHYSESEMIELLTQRAKRLRWSISEDAVAALARRGRGTPRIGIRLLEAARRTARSVDAESITAEHVSRMCQIESYDEIGLDAIERRYLQLLREAQGPLRLNVIATHMGLPRRTIEAVVESELIRLGMVSKSEDGRMLTAAGSKHLSETSE